MEQVLTKKMVSMRLDEGLLDLMDRVCRIKGTYFYDRDRTWLVEHAIRETFTPILEAESPEEEDLPPK